SSTLLFSNHPSTTDIYTLSLHDALPILCVPWGRSSQCSLPPKIIQEIFNHPLYPNPGIGIIGFKNKIQTGFFTRLFNINHCSSYVYIAPIITIAIQRSSPPYQNSPSRKVSNRIY